MEFWWMQRPIQKAWLKARDGVLGGVPLPSGKRSGEGARMG